MTYPLQAGMRMSPSETRCPASTGTTCLLLPGRICSPRAQLPPGFHRFFYEPTDDVFTARGQHRPTFHSGTSRRLIWHFAILLFHASYYYYIEEKAAEYHIIASSPVHHSPRQTPPPNFHTSYRDVSTSCFPRARNSCARALPTGTYRLHVFHVHEVGPPRCRALRGTPALRGASVRRQMRHFGFRRKTGESEISNHPQKPRRPILSENRMPLPNNHRTLDAKYSPSLCKTKRQERIRNTPPASRKSDEKNRRKKPTKKKKNPRLKNRRKKPATKPATKKDKTGEKTGDTTGEKPAEKPAKTGENRRKPAKTGENGLNRSPVFAGRFAGRSADFAGFRRSMCTK